MAAMPESGAHARRLRGRRRRSGEVSGAWLAWLTLFGVAPAAADSLFLQPALIARETVTSNANFGTELTSQGDVLSELIPSLVMRSIGKNLTVDANFFVDAIDYLHGSEPNRALPNGGIDALFKALDQHLFIDASALAAQSLSNVFAASPQGASTYNTFTTVNYRLSPYFKGELPGGVFYVLRNDNGWVRANGSGSSALADTQLTRGSVDIDKLPKAFGWNVHVETDDTVYTESNIFATHESVARLTLKAAVDPELVVGLRGGAEKENFLIDTGRRAIWGAELHWRPQDRTDVNMYGERRFFGAKWDFDVKHNVNRFVLNIDGDRDVLTSAQATFALSPSGHGMADMLDAMLLVSVPDPIERARQVQELLSQEGLSGAIASAVPIYDATPVLITRYSAAITWLGRRDAVSFAFYDLYTQFPSGMLPPLVALESAFGENDQRSFALTITHHLTPNLSLSAYGRISMIDGLAASTGDYTRQNAGTLQLTDSLTPRTDVFGGVRLQAIESNVTPQAREKAAFIGVGHRF